MGDSLKTATARGTVWSMAERISSQLVTFVVIVVMSRILSQTDYGLVGMLVIFTDIAQTLVDSGVTQALIRKQDRTPKDCSTAFYFNVCLSLVLYGVMYLCAPLIAEFYNQEELTRLTRVLSLSFVINAFMMVQQALMTARLDFKTQTIASLTAAVISGGAGIWMAYHGMGVWAIVYYQLLKSGLNCMMLWILSEWRPVLAFSFPALKYFFNFGSKLTAAALMQTIYKDMYLALIGKFYKPAAVGYYTRAHQFGALPSFNVSAILQRVTYPAMCRVQDDEERLKDMFGKFLRVITFMVFPMMAGLAVLATPVTVLLVGEKWAFSGTLLSILCLSMMWMPIDFLNLSLLQVRGRTDCFLKCEIWKKVIGVTLLVVTLPFGLVVMCWGQLVRALADFAIDTYYTHKFIGMGVLRQWRMILPSIVYSAVMAVCVWLSVNWIATVWLQVVVGLICGVAVFIGLAWTTGSRELREIRSLVNEFKKRGK